MIEIIKQFNWVDIFVLIILVRTIYVSAKVGFPITLFKLFGTISAIYLSMHYYSGLSGFLAKSFLIEKIPLQFLDFLVFLALAELGYIVFVLLRSVFYHFVKVEAISTLNKWGGLAVGIIRSALLCGLVIFIMAISSVGYFESSVKYSYLGRRFFSIGPGTYSFLWNSVASKFFTQEKINPAISEIEKNFYAK